MQLIAFKNLERTPTFRHLDLSISEIYIFFSLVILTTHRSTQARLDTKRYVISKKTKIQEIQIKSIKNDIKIS